VGGGQGRRVGLSVCRLVSGRDLTKDTLNVWVWVGVICIG